ncbi:tellurium resistance protein [Acinetobacter silvestris]|uniref:Tellurium resistance protein n=1 Tax=Acinetobacter silvestris TaxID=1977882 RepID=A0A1Y3CL49_9GAMM|nr:tellurium resistance protein [Acinetobacter silvestris]OTG66619.1 tellurium resistance protein [Acinetobacter silvestris]
MQQFKALIPLELIEISREELLAIKRNDLVPLLDDQVRMNLYADQIIQAQSVLLNGVDRQLTQKLSQVIAELIKQLSYSKNILKPKKLNRLQKWLGLDLEFDTDKIKYLKDLDRLIDEANILSQKLKIEIQKSESRFQQAMGYREQMAKYIVAAQEFLYEYPNFVSNRHPLDNFGERLSKKINTLQTLQANNDIALAQMQLTQQLSLGLMDRFKEAQQVLIPAWHYHLKQGSTTQSQNSLAELDQSRDKLIQTLKQSLEKK